MVFTAHGEAPRKAPRRWVSEAVVRTADRVVALSEGEAESYLRRGVPAEGVTVIPNGVPPEGFPYVDPPPLGTQLRLLYVGQLIHAKGIHLLLDAIAAVRDQLSVALDLVYQGGPMAAELGDRARRYGMTDVTFHGALAGPELHAMYADCHALALPSLTEVLPSVITEALYVGRPVLSTRVGAVQSQIAGFGQAVEPGDAGALAGGILGIASEYSALAKRAAEVSARARERFSVENMVVRHEQLYKETLQTQAGLRRSHLRARGIAASAVGAYASRRATQLGDQPR
jgi:glycosyltransferase involved in cell wall biosynthesis